MKLLQSAQTALLCDMVHMCIFLDSYYNHTLLWDGEDIKVEILYIGIVGSQ